jgi:glycosyltransferase involved in cell wall biosynthesis
MRFVPNAYLWLLGDGETRDELVETAKRYGLMDRLRMPGWVPNPGPYIAAGNVFCCPSTHEPLGNVVLEGWAQEKPVVATASEGPSWLISNHENGLLTRLKDATALGHAFQYIQMYPEVAEKIAHAGYLELQNQFSKDKICKQYMDLLFAGIDAADK